MKTQNNSQRSGSLNRNTKSWKAMAMKIRRSAMLFVLFSFVLWVTPALANTVYVTADDLNGTNLFGTVNIATGQFTQITATSQLFLALTTGPGDQIIGADANSGNLYTISPSGGTSQFGTVTAPDTFFGLAYSSSAGKFFADNLNSMNVSLYSILGNGNSSSFIGQMAGPNSGFFPTGNLAFGPAGKLYFDFFPTNGASSVLYTVNTSTGGLTQLGSGLGTDILSLFSDGSTLYGIDANTTSNTGIYTINTITGLATRISTVTGLPGDNFFVDAATSTPDSGSTIGLLFLAMAGLTGTRHFRWARCTPSTKTG
jgi:hypothetical protein